MVLCLFVSLGTAWLADTGALFQVCSDESVLNKVRLPRIFELMMMTVGDPTLD